MKSRLVVLLVLTSLNASLGFAAEQTLTGVISDSLCAASHATMAEQVSPPLSDPDCTKACVDANGKFVLVADNKKVFQIANQTFAQLRDLAGKKVKLTGDVKGDSVTITALEAADDAKK
jgi:hypothetical protein